MQVSQSVKFAALIVVLTTLYFLARGLFGDGGEAVDAVAPARFTVVTQTVSPQTWQAEIVVRGRTAAERKVIVRAEIAGAVAATPTPEGASVRKGDVLCQIEVNARQAELAEARAALNKARLDYNAAVKLHEGGFRSDTAVAAAKAALDLAVASTERTGIILSKTKISAPFDGVFDHRNVEIGDFLSVGDPCGTVIQRSPFLVIGAVSEKDVAKISKNDRGVARLATGEIIEGVVRFVAAAADPATRTFTVELQVPNEDGALRDGVTADFTIFAKKRTAHHIPRSSLTLGDDGGIGVRTLGADGAVQFKPVRLLGEDPSGVWVGGLDGATQLIVRGQDFVSAGQMVEAVDVEAIKAGPNLDAGATP
ncbi:MAG: efflux RND transporter periplasmic adaptor subunit [Alphaproteobacteria bacterium]|nr:efflux RND transporter periplasmic adaptor subunit [Alphaproteobacteria bacterium]